jgi:hypothetical protein
VPEAREYEYYPVTWREPYLGRRRSLGWQLYAVIEPAALLQVAVDGEDEADGSAEEREVAAQLAPTACSSRP